MKIFNREIKLPSFGVSNEHKEIEQVKSKARKLINAVINTQLSRFHNQIALWKTGIDEFEDVDNPVSEDLIRVYNDVVLDAHLAAILAARKSKTISKEFKFVSESGEEVPETTKIFKTQWFNKVMSLALDSNFFGYTLLQFGDRTGTDFENVSVVPREYVNGHNKHIRTSPNSQTGTPYNKGVFVPWILPVGDASELGLLSTLAPMVIYKNNALGAWADFIEVFGSPLRIGKTDIKDDELRGNMSTMLETMGATAWGVLDKEDEVEFVQSTTTDAFEVFDKNIERANSEMSKGVLGSTMTVDDGSSRSQSEVHEKTSGAIEKADAVAFEYWMNKSLIPFLNTYHGFNITETFMFDNSETITVSEQFERDMKLNEFYKVPIDYIIETYGVPVEEKELPTEPTPGKETKNVENMSYADQIRNLYENN